MKKNILQAVWGHDYDLHTDMIYKCPCCPKCMEPIVEDDGKYICVSCRKEIIVDDDKMKLWFEERAGTKTEYVDCCQIKLRDGVICGCGGKQCMKITYVKDKADLHWVVAFGICEKCGARFLV